MFDFSGLKAISANDDDEKYSFVGIRNIELRLPKGCEAWAESINLNKEPDKKFVAMQDAFLSLYRTLRAYRQARDVSLTNDRDGGQQGGEGGQELTLGSYEEDGEIVNVIYYRHLDMLDSILEAYDELAILSLAQRIGRSERLDYSKLHQHLDRATFLDDDSFVVDKMLLPRQQVSFEPVEIVQMYCFVLLEIKKWLGEEDGVASDVRVLAEQFFEHHLSTGDGLFEFDTWEGTRDILRERLEIIDQNTAYKDDAYHDFYDSLGCFLWGNMQPSEDGIQWGIKTFAPVWESMCLSYLIEDRLPEIAACDTSSLPYVLTDKLRLLTNMQELVIDNKIVANLRTTSALGGVFKLNENVLFPDCVLIRDPAMEDLKNARNSLYQACGVDGLQYESKHTACNDIIDICKKITDELNAEEQQKAVDQLVEKLSPTLPDNLTAFFLGKKLCASFQSLSKCFWPKEQLCELLLTDRIGTNFHLNFLRGMLWEVYFDKDDKLRDKLNLSSHKALHSYNLAMDKKLYVDGKTHINELYRFFELADEVIKSNKFVQCTIVDFKYFSAAYFHASENAANIRTRLVRKQFVYEYLLNEKLSKSAERYSIGSEFWIPCYDKDHATAELSPNEPFLGGSIPLRRLNVAALMDIYWKLATKEVEIAYCP